MTTAHAPAVNGGMFTDITVSTIRDQARQFRLTPLARRGYDPEAVREYLERVAAAYSFSQEQARHGRAAVAENERLKDALRRWQSKQSGPDAYGHVPRTAVNMLADAQRHADETLAQADEVVRQREQEALDLYQRMVDKAYADVEAIMATAHRDGATAAASYRSSAGAAATDDGAELQRVRATLRTVLQSLRGTHIGIGLLASMAEDVLRDDDVLYETEMRRRGTDTPTDEWQQTGWQQPAVAAR